jgi:hypothetical protein
MDASAFHPSLSRTVPILSLQYARRVEMHADIARLAVAVGQVRSP